jgi:5-hydroxyisourate hydrolase-like protein (transthyretin family)
MRFSARYLPAVLLLILSLPTSLWAHAALKQTSKTPRGSISGRVTIKGKGVAGVVITLRRSEFINPNERVQRTRTDEDGNYRITNLAAGSYDISPLAPAFVPADSKEQRSRNVIVSDDETVESINFSLVRGGVITGRVTDADGRPIIQQQVYVYRMDLFEREPQRANRPLFVTNSVATDDRGIYRVFGLAPGRYKIGAGRSDDANNAPMSGGRSSYLHVFHPDVSDQAEATVIEIGEGTEATNVDVTLGRTMQTFAVAGRVVDGERGLPVPNVRVGMQRLVGGRLEYVNANATTNMQGDFVVEGLIPGTYGVFLLQSQNNGMRVEARTFDVIDQDVSGLTVKLVQGANLSGVIVVETESKAALPIFSELQLRAWVANQNGRNGYGLSAQSPIAPDGSFFLSGLPAGFVQMMMGNTKNPLPAKGFNIVRFERDGVVLTNGIEIKEGEQLTGLRVVFSFGNATLRGVVTVENGTLPTGARFFVRVTKSGDKFSNLRLPQVDARGRFLMEGLAPGMYEVKAGVGGVGMQLREVKREVNVPDGVTDVTISIDLSTPSKP